MRRWTVWLCLMLLGGCVCTSSATWLVCLFRFPLRRGRMPAPIRHQAACLIVFDREVGTRCGKTVHNSPCLAESPRPLSVYPFRTFLLGAPQIEKIEKIAVSRLLVVFHIPPSPSGGSLLVGGMMPILRNNVHGLINPYASWGHSRRKYQSSPLASWSKSVAPRFEGLGVCGNIFPVHGDSTVDYGLCSCFLALFAQSSPGVLKLLPGCNGFLLSRLCLASPSPSEIRLAV